MCLAALPNRAQAPQKVDYYPSGDLVQDGDQLASKTEPGSGLAKMILQKYPQHYTMMMVRNKSGEVELHRSFAEIFVIVDGSAVLRSGGRMLNPNDTGPGELRGSSMGAANRSSSRRETSFTFRLTLRTRSS